MPNPSRSRLWGILFLVASLMVPLALTTATPAQAADKTSSTEAKRVDRVKTPKIKWVENTDLGGYTATVKLPLDYDQPTGSTVNVALFKVPAANPSARIGTLFVNPGGPGGSGVEMAEAATSFLSQTVLDHFDVVGFDPRGTNGSSPLACFSSSSAQAAALSGRSEEFPSASEQSAYISSSQKLATACSKYGLKVASAMSTAEVARDMDVLRRAVGDKKLTYLGFSYGSYLGEVYANLFPDRFRALAIDGVINPVAWAGTSITSSLPASIRNKSGDASWAALVAGLAACKAAGSDYCPLEDPQADFDEVAAALKKSSITLGSGTDAFTYSYSDFISDLLSMLYYPEGMDYVAETIAGVQQALDSQGSSTSSTASNRAAGLIRAFHRSVALENGGYDDSLEAYSGVMCTDSYQPKDTSAWATATSRADVLAPHFSLIWGWADVQCATSYWKAKDEDAYHGTYSRNTAVTVLIVGNYHDPATNYAGAVETRSLMPNSVLLRSDSWGHTAYGTSDCVTDRVDTYLVTGKVPSGTATTVCTGDVGPFTLSLTSSPAGGSGNARVQVPSRKGLPPVEIPWLRNRP